MEKYSLENIGVPYFARLPTGKKVLCRHNLSELPFQKHHHPTFRISSCDAHV